MIEIWKDVRNFEGRYQVSNFGRVKSLYKNGKQRILKPLINGEYQQIQLYNHYKKEQPLIHRLVFETFYRRLLPNEECHHINQMSDDNRAVNLVARDAFLHESEHKKGKPSPMKGKKLSEEHKAKISAANKGKKKGPMSEQHRLAIAAGNRGKKRGPYKKHNIK